MKVIYVSGKFRADSYWGIFQNVRHAEGAALRLWKQGYAVVCPHLNTANFQGAIANDAIWLQGDLEILSRCDAIYMLKDWERSKGAKRELEVAIENNLEVLYE